MKDRKFLQGLLFGFGAIVVMLKPLDLGNGLIFDGRSVLIALAALYHGPISGLTAATLAVAVRVFIGGDGTFVGALVIFTAALVGSVGRPFLLRYPNKSALVIYSSGLTLHILMVLLMLLLPNNRGPAVIALLGLPIVLAYPLALLLVGLVIENQVQRRRADAKLRSREAELHTIFNASSDAILIHHGSTHKILDANHAALLLYRCPNIESLIEFFMDPRSLETPPWDSEQALNYLDKARDQGPQHFEWQALRADGTAFWADVTMSSAEIEDQAVIITSVRDISDRKEARDALARQNQLFVTLLKNMAVGVFMVDAKNGKPLLANDTAVELMGRGVLPEATRENLANEYHAVVYGTREPYPVNRMPITLGMEGISSIIDDMVIIRPDGGETLIEVRGTPVFDQAGRVWASLVTFYDISARKAAEDKLQATLAQKEALLTEVYHRTKNNMQVIISLLSLQKSRITDPAISQVIKGTIGRIMSMSLVHNKLYQSPDLAHVYLDEYLGELCPLVLENNSARIGQVDLELDLAHIQVTIEEVLPCGLLVNELMTNSLKYGFPEDSRGIISLKLIWTADGKIELSYRDDGIGMEDFADWDSPTTLGLTLIRALAENQLHGETTYSLSPGFAMTVRFEPISPGA